MTACFNSTGKTPDNSERLTMRSKTGKSVSKHCFTIGVGRGSIEQIALLRLLMIDCNWSLLTSLKLSMYDCGGGSYNKTNSVLFSFKLF